MANKTITFTTAPAVNSVISTRVFAISGENYRVLDQYTGDGSTVAFTTSTRGEFNLDSTVSDIYITIDGVPTHLFRLQGLTNQQLPQEVLQVLEMKKLLTMVLQIDTL